MNNSTTTTDVKWVIQQWLTHKMEVNPNIFVIVIDNQDHSRFDISVSVNGSDIAEEINRVEAFLYDFTADHKINDNVFTCWMPYHFTQEFALTYEI